MMPGTRLPRDTSAGWLTHAPAKLNVYLEVLPKRPDGFHGIQTLLCPVRLYDTLLIRPTSNQGSRVKLSVPSRLPGQLGEAAPTDDSNLVARALHLTWRAAGVAPSCEVVLEKRIPSRAGLGGGSSDAAAAILAANHIWRLGLAEEELTSIASKVGSDVPGLLHGQATWCEGRGEVVTPVAIPGGLPVVIAKQPEGLSTADVFRQCGPAQNSVTSDTPHRLVAALQSGKLEELPKLMTNRLQEAAGMLCGSVARLRELFSRLPVVAHQLTGSGAAWFGVFRNYRSAARAAALLRAEGVCWATATTIIGGGLHRQKHLTAATS